MIKKITLSAILLANTASGIGNKGINSGLFSNSSTNYRRQNIEQQIEEERKTEEKWNQVREHLVKRYGEDAIPLIKNAKDYNDCLREVNKQYDKDQNRCDKRGGNEGNDCYDRAERVQDKNASRCERIGHSDNIKDAVNGNKDKKDKDKKDKKDNDCQGDNCKAE